MDSVKRKFIYLCPKIVVKKYSKNALAKAKASKKTIYIFLFIF